MSPFFIKGNTPWIPHPISVNLRASLAANKRIVLRNGVTPPLPRSHINPQNFSQKRIEILSISFRRTPQRFAGFIFIVPITTLPHRQVQQLLAAERDATTIVVKIRFIDLQKHAFRLKAGAHCVIGHTEFGEPERAVPTWGSTAPKR